MSGLSDDGGKDSEPSGKDDAFQACVMMTGEEVIAKQHKALLTDTALPQFCLAAPSDGVFNGQRWGKLLTA